jgi:CheY-like chemotaxis protein
MARILIIDDDLDIIDSIGMILEGNGHQVESRTHTGGLIEAVETIHPDLILLDIIFPDDEQAGFRAARELRRTPALAAIPVIILSAVNQRSALGFSFSERDISDDFMPVGGFLDKPVEPATLLARIDELLSNIP